jgi:predicted HicB family RNase H-like nuclease
MLEYKGYLGKVEADDGIFVGRVAGLRDVITFEGATFAEVEQAFLVIPNCARDGAITCAAL